MAKQEEVDYTHELSHTDASHPSANALFIPEWYGWVPSARHTPTLARGMLPNAVHAYSSVKLHVTNLM